MTSPRTTPLHERHEALGASFTDFGGWLMPVRYSSDLAEHHAVRTAAGLFDISHMAEFMVEGPQAGAFLDYALAGRLSTLADDQAKYSLLLDVDGGIIDDVIVYRFGAERYMVVANAGNRDAVAPALSERAPAHLHHAIGIGRRTGLFGIRNRCDHEPHGSRWSQGPLHMRWFSASRQAL